MSQPLDDEERRLLESLLKRYVEAGARGGMSHAIRGVELRAETGEGHVLLADGDVAALHVLEEDPPSWPFAAVSSITEVYLVVRCVASDKGGMGESLYTILTSGAAKERGL